MAAIDLPKLAAPKGNGEVLVFPTPEECIEALRTNIERLDGHKQLIAGRRLGEWRRRIRRMIWGNDDIVVIGTGHQPGFVHPGVWAKSVVASRMAKAVGGVAAHLVVDSDTPKETAIRIPVEDGAGLRVEAVGMIASNASLYEQIPAVGSERLDEISGLIRTMLGDRFHRTHIPEFWEGMKKCAAPRCVVDQLVAGVRVIDSAHGVEVADVRMGRAWWRPLLAHVVGHAHSFFEVYNGALERYRRMHRVRGRGRPFPDLMRVDDRIELPVWVFRGDSARQRLYVGVTSSGTSLWAGDEFIRELGDREIVEWAEDESAASLDGWSFRPRAVLLTMWARLFLCDFFIHGIGGAIYDEVTDQVIRDFFQVEPPGYGCVSATLWLGLAVPDVSVDHVRRLRHELRDLQWNGQRHLSDRNEVAEWIEKKRAFVGAAERLRRERRGDHAARGSVFRELRAVQSELRRYTMDAQNLKRQEIGDVEKRLADRAIATGREYFVGLFGREELNRLCDALPGEKGFRV